jgi:Domain of unknown function (DUF5666)
MENDMNTFIIHSVKYFQALMLAVALAACGGGGSQVADVGTSGTGIVASGTITGFGSVFVNGVKFSTSSSTAISDDGANKAESELKVGQVVEIKGSTTSAGNANASSIAVNKELKGPVDIAYNATDKTLGVLGQTVITDNNTLIDNNLSLGTAGLSALAIGTQVEVSGFRQPDGRIRATRIEGQNPAARLYKLRGSISDLNSTAPSFKIGSITVNYPGITIQNLPSGGIVTGLQVEVRATSAPLNNAITAARIEVKGGVGGRSGDKAEVEGLIANLSGCTFSVNGQAVDACGSVEFKDGGRTELADGKRVEAEGQLASDGKLVASKVEFKSSSGSGGGSGSGDTSTFVRVNAQVQTPPNKTDRTITLLGKTFVVSASTQFEDKVSSIDSFADIIKPGDILEIRGFADNSGQLNATLVERNDDNDIIIEGKLEQKTATQLVVQGVTVRVGLNTQFKDAGENTITRLQFDAGAAIGAKVKAKGTSLGASDPTVDATSGEVEIEA